MELEGGSSLKQPLSFFYNAIKQYLQVAGSWQRALMAESMTKHEVIWFSYPFGVRSRLAALELSVWAWLRNARTYTQVYIMIRMDDTFTFIVAPRVVKNKSAMQSVPDLSFLCEGTGTQSSLPIHTFVTTIPGSTIVLLQFVSEIEIFSYCTAIHQ